MSNVLPMFTEVNPKHLSTFDSTRSYWAKELNNAQNFLGLDDSSIEKTLELCPPKEYSGFYFLGRNFIPTTQVQHNPEEQSRDKEVDNDSQRALKHEFEKGFLPHIASPAPVIFNPDVPYQVTAMGGFHRKPVLEEIGQSFYMFDVYCYYGNTIDRDKWKMRNQCNHHRGYHKFQTKQDYIKEMCNAIELGFVENTETAITQALDEICDFSSDRKKTIIKEVTNNCQTYANFRTYTSQNNGYAKYTLQGWLESQGIAKAGIENRKPDEIVDQGYISYCCGEGDNKGTWMRAIVNSVKFGVPVYMFGYAPTRQATEGDLQTYREEWIKDFVKQKATLLDFFNTVASETQQEFTKNFPIKIAGFLPQYIKPDAKHKGRPSENTLVDQYGKSLNFDKEAKCLSADVA
jgi:hypothetical protein